MNTVIINKIFGYALQRPKFEMIWLLKDLKLEEGA
jgi:hypothetical protein